MAHFRHESGRLVELQRHDAALIAHLALRGTTPRAALLALLWPDGDTATMRNRLRQRMFALKQRIGLAPVVGQAQLSLNPALRWAGLSADAASAPLLAGHEYDDLPDFARWLAQERQRLLAAVREQWVSRAQALETEGRLAEALALAGKIVALDPLHEHAHRRLMRLHYLRGDRAAALLAFDACEAVLKDELGTRPSHETLQLMSQIEQAQLPVPVRPAQPAPASVMRPPRLVGRDAVWARLEQAWSQGDAVVLVGEAGLGKTRLVTDLLRSHEPCASLHVAARPGDEGVPYALLSRLLRALLARRRAPLADGVRGELMRLLPELAAATDPAAPPHTPAARARFVSAVETTLQDAAGEGLRAVALDDLHFSDEASLELAQHLAGVSEVRWLVALRPEGLERAAQQLVDHLVVERRGAAVRLSPLAPAEVAELVDSLGLGSALPPGLPDALHRHSGGNPLFLLEALKLVLQGGAASRSLAAAPGERLPTTAGVRRLVDGRLARLSPMAVRLARCAAIAGQDFNAALACHVLGTRAIDLADAWAELASADVLHDKAFAHDLIHDAALASVPEPIARNLHAEVADWLAAGAGEPARIAHHWQRSGRADKAGPAWLEAAERCGLRGRRVEESQLLERAAAAFAEAGQARQRSQALLHRVEVASHYADLPTAIGALEAAATAIVDDEDRLRLEAIGICIRSDDDHTLQHAPPTLALARRLGRHDTVLLLTIRYAGALARTGRATEGVELLTALRTWVEGTGTPDQQREHSSALALALDHAGCMREALRAWQRTVDHAEQLDSDLLSQALGNMAYTCAKMGAVARAAQLGERALAVVRETGDGFDQQLLHRQLALGHHLRNLGRYGEAVPLLEAAAAGYRQSQGALGADAAEHFLAVAWLQLGQPARALQLLAGDALSSSVPRVRAMRLAFRALARHAAGQDASGPMRESLALHGDPESLWFRTHTLIATAIVPPDEGEPLAAGLAAWALARERFGLALAAHSRAASCALAQGAARRAAPHVEIALQLARDYQPDVFYLPELWWVAAQVHGALGQAGARQQALIDGARWVARAAELHVPAEFSDSFLRRNRVNAELLSAARAAGAAP